jgi:hypothetical protein
MRIISVLSKVCMMRYHEKTIQGIGMYLQVKNDAQSIGGRSIYALSIVEGIYYMVTYVCIILTEIEQARTLKMQSSEARFWSCRRDSKRRAYATLS